MADPNLTACCDKATIFYDVIRQLRNCDFKYFARTKLKLPEHDIDNIETDVSRDVQEQQYKMLLQWESKSENGPDRLLELLQEYRNECPSNRNSTIGMNIMTSSDLQYRLVVEKVCHKLTDDEIQRLNNVYFSCTKSNFTSGRDLFYYMEDHNLWGEGRATRDKLLMVKQSLQNVDRNDLVLEIDQMLKEYLVPSLPDMAKSHRWSTTDVEIDALFTKVIRRGFSAPNTPHRKTFRVSATYSEPPIHIESMGEEYVGDLASHSSGVWLHSLSSDALFLKGAGSETSLGKPRLEEVVSVKDENDLIKEGNTNGALDVIRRQMQLDHRLRDIPALLKCYQIAAKAGNLSEVNRDRENLTSLIQNYVETSAGEIKAFAEKLRGCNSNLNAIIFYFISSDFYVSERAEQNVTSRFIERCAHGIKQASLRMLQVDATSVNALTAVVIPSLEALCKKIQRLFNDDATSRCINEAKCLRHISTIEDALGNHKVRLKLLFDAVTLLRNHFGPNDVNKYYVYGRCLNAIGRTYGAMKDLPSAKQHFQMALEAIRQAEDFESEQDRMVEVKTIQNNMKSVGL